jgi:flagellar protein FliO/FliZ
MKIGRSTPLWALLCAAVPVAPALAQAAQTAQPAAAATGSTGSLFQVLFGLIAVLGLMAGAAWLLKRFNLSRSGTAGNVRIVGGVSVGSRERGIVVEVADQWIVVGVAPGRVNALSTMPRQDAAPVAGDAPGANPSGNFSSWLKQTIDRRNAP